jgi:hypothetical protein
VLEHLAEITEVDPAAAGWAADEMPGLLVGRRLPGSRVYEVNPGTGRAAYRNVGFAIVGGLIKPHLYLQGFCRTSIDYGSHEPAVLHEATERSLRGIGLVSRSPRWPNLARHFPTGRALVSDKTGLSSKRRNPHDLLHGGAAAWAGDYTSSSRKLRHNSLKLVLSHPASIRHQSNGFPFARGTFAATISHANQALLARPQV